MRHECGMINSAQYVGAEIIAHRSAVVWLCNPGNPAGHVIGKSLLTELVTSRRDTLFVIDQAYADYTLKPVMTGAEAVACGNVILLNSLTKRFSVPGRRHAGPVRPHGNAQA
mgnify:CR=1 FL=1